MKFVKAFANITRMFLFLLSFYYLIITDFKSLGSICMTLMLTFLPKLIKNIFNFELSPLFIFIYIILVTSSPILGQICGLYYTCWYFDIILHALSGIMLFDLGMSISKNEETNLNKILFSIFFSIAFAVLWEVGEFVDDYFFNTNNQFWKFDITNPKNILIGFSIQPTGLIDTMTDIIANGALTIFCAISVYINNKIFKN